MTRARLDLGALRRLVPSGFLTAALPPAPTETDPASTPSGVSRRTAIQTAGLAAAGFFPALKHFHVVLGGLELVGDERRLAFVLGGRERWVIDVARFAGTPRLRHERQGGRIRVELSGAHYPGTNLPADFVCEVTPDLLGCRMQLTLALGGFRCDTPFEGWLEGTGNARSRVRLRQRCPLGAGASLAVAGGAEADFSPAWVLTLNGAGLVELRGAGLGGPVTADALTLALPPADEPSVLAEAPARRARFTLARGTRSWRIQPRFRPTRGTLRYAAEPFDAITIETGEQDRRVVRALVATTGNGAAAAWYAPATGLVDGAGSTPDMPLHHARYAVAFNRGGEQRVLLASFGEPTWMHGPGFSIEVGSGGETDPAQFELIATGARGACTTRCEPALLRTVVPVAGALVTPAPAAPGSHIDLTGESADARVCYDLARGCSGLFVAPAPPLSILRPKDLLALDFEFVNLALDLKGAGQADLVRQAPGANSPNGSFVIVRFPPQNIAEQAFWETAADAADKPITLAQRDSDGNALGAKDASYEKPKGDETPGASDMPVKARIAGRSRLAFRLPAGLDRIEYTLPSLLDWTRFEPSVPATALPPPPPPGPLIMIAAAQPQGVVARAAGVDVAHKVKAAPHVDAGVQQNVAQQIQRAAPRRGAVPQDRVNALAATIVQVRPGSPALTQAAINDLAAKMQLPPYAPAAHETGIESPYRLIVSPNRFSCWVHATGDVTREHPTDDPVKPAVTELWHTRLAVKRAPAPPAGENPADEEEDYYRTIRAVWSPDYDATPTDEQPPHFPANHPGNPFRTSLDARDRHELVTLTADHRLVDSAERIVRVDRMMLSALGSWMNVRGGWDLGPVTAQIIDINEAGNHWVAPVSVEEWRHRATMGRDHYVRVVYKGCLFPFGHKASLIKVTERKFQTVENHQVAFLRQRMFVVVRQPEKLFPADFQPFEGRKFPFKRVRLLTLITPNLDRPEDDPIISVPQAQNAFWLNVLGEPFLFSVVAEDVEGHTPQFTMPLAFIDNKKCMNGAAAAAAIASFAGRPERTRPLHGQKVSFADPQKPGDTTFETESLTFGAHFIKASAGDATAGALNPVASDATLAAHDLPRFYPTVEGASVEIPAVKHLTGAAGAVPIKFPQRYIERGFAGALGDAAGNYGQLFAELDAPAGLGFGNGGVGTDKVGGFAAPSLNILGLSRLTGPVSGQAATGLSDMLKGSFDPKKFFEGLDVKLLGAVSLLDIVQLVTDGFAADLDNLRTKMEQEIAALPGKATAAALGALPKCRVPAFLTQAIYDAENAAAKVDEALKRPKQIQLVFKWDPVVNSVGPFRVDGTPSDTLSLTSLGLVELPLDGSPPKPPSYTVSAALKKFTLDLFGVIAIRVNSVSFTKQANEKPDVSADIDTIEFAGPLRFVNELQSVIPSDGFADPPSLEVTPTGLKLGYSLGLPTIAVGAFTLQNVTLGAGLSLPFTGDALRFRFFFCTREQPFLITVYGLGGGGFFAIELGMDGVELLEASLEFGASVAIDLGVASGGVTIMGGIYFKVESDVTTLTGFVRLNGELDVLGLISASLTFYLALTYQSSPEMVWGEATLTIEVEVVFFSADVEVSVRKEFATPPPPPFDQLMTDDEWATYRLAFAA
ncbi:MAG TPA: hypothetical protein VGQ18_05185 [Gemmatimonadales bacterium]|nr:hypothetical protein [Gemmatimonadales bacterium]